MRTRKDERLATSRAIVVSLPGSDLAATMVDISRTGCKIEVDTDRVGVGSTVVIEMSGETIASGEIVWLAEQECGVAFHRQISAEQVDRVAAVIG